MIGEGDPPARGQPARRLLRRLSGKAIDDPGVARMTRRKKPPQLVARTALWHDLVEQVGAVVAGGEHRRIAKPELGDDVAPGLFVRGRGQRQQRHARKPLFEDRELLVFGPEIMAPLRDAMRLVDREQRQPRPPQEIETARRHQPFGRHVEQVERAVADRPFDRRGFRRRQPRIQRRGAHVQPGRARRPGPSSARSAARRRRQDPGAAAPGSGSKAICRPRSASARPRRRRPPPAR